MKTIRSNEMLHPIMQKCIKRIEKEVILKHSIPIRIFETGRVHDRHQALVQRGKTKDLMSGHLFDLNNEPPWYAIAVDYVHYDGKWSWNLRDSTVNAWYLLFGNLVLDICPELQWGAESRKSVNFCHFELRRDIVLEHFDDIPCVLPK